MHGRHAVGVEPAREPAYVPAGQADTLCTPAAVYVARAVVVDHDDDVPE